MRRSVRPIKHGEDALIHRRRCDPPDLNGDDRSRRPCEREPCVLTGTSEDETRGRSRAHGAGRIAREPQLQGAGRSVCRLDDHAVRSAHGQIGEIRGTPGSVDAAAAGREQRGVRLVYGEIHAAGGRSVQRQRGDSQSEVLSGHARKYEPRTVPRIGDRQRKRGAVDRERNAGQQRDLEIGAGRRGSRGENGRVGSRRRKRRQLRRRARPRRIAATKRRSGRHRDRVGQGLRRRLSCHPRHHHRLLVARRSGDQRAHGLPGTGSQRQRGSVRGDGSVGLQPGVERNRREARTQQHHVRSGNRQLRKVDRQRTGRDRADAELGVVRLVDRVGDRPPRRIDGIAAQLKAEPVTSRSIEEQRSMLGRGEYADCLRGTIRGEAGARNDVRGRDRHGSNDEIGRADRGPRASGNADPSRARCGRHGKRKLCRGDRRRRRRVLIELECGCTNGRIEAGPRHRHASSRGSRGRRESGNRRRA